MAGDGRSGEEKIERRGLSSLAIHAGSPTPRVDAPVVTPLVHSTTFFMDPRPPGEVRYTRYGTNPNHLSVAAKLAALEGAEAALPTGSGMGAISATLLANLNAGDHLVASRHLYGGTLGLLTGELPRLGIRVTLVDDDWESAVRPATRALLVEAISNPLLRVQDPVPLVRLARDRGLVLIVDATFATPVNLRPLEHGADIVVHSATKYLGGHSDVTAGVVAGSLERVEAARRCLRSFGQNLDPAGAWLLERGLKTLVVRVERQNQNAMALARVLSGHGSVTRVHHPGLEDHPDHALARRLLRGYGGMLGVVVRGGDEAALAALRRLRMVRVAPSLGGVESLASMPRYTSHVHMSDDERATLGIEPGFIRFSIGIEDARDLEADIGEALRGEAG